jgi:hypothetical protein
MYISGDITAHCPDAVCRVVMQSSYYWVSMHDQGPGAVLSYDDTAPAATSRGISESRVNCDQVKKYAVVLLRHRCYIDSTPRKMAMEAAAIEDVGRRLKPEETTAPARTLSSLRMH